MATGDPFDADEATRFRRRVLLPVRPLDLELLLDPEGALAGGAEEEATEEEAEGTAGEREEGAQAGSVRDGGSQGTADGDVPTVGECVRRAVVGAGANQTRQALQAHLNEPISNYADFIRQNNLMGYIHEFCWVHLQ
jgi:hypothetical protein